MTRLLRRIASAAVVILNVSNAYAIGDSAGCGRPIDSPTGRALAYGSPQEVESRILSALDYHEKQLGWLTTDATRIEFRHQKARELMNGSFDPCSLGPYLNFAAKAGNVEVVRYLLGSPLGVTLKIPSDILVSACGRHEVFHDDTPEEIERRRATVKLILDTGKVDINAKVDINPLVKGKTALYWCKDPDLTSLFIERGANVNVEYDHYNFLDIAVLDAATDWGDSRLEMLHGLERAKIYAKFLPATIEGRQVENKVIDKCTRSVNRTSWSSRACQEMARFIKASPMVFGRPGTEKPNCNISNLTLPKDYSILVAGAYSGRELPFQIDLSGEMAHQVDTTVNSPDKPVVLILGGYHPIIWNIKWSPGTKILAVIVSGHYRQAVAGLEPEVRVLDSSTKLTPNLHPDRRNDKSLEIVGACGEWTDKLKDTTFDRYMDVSMVARHLFGRSVEHTYRAKDGQVLIGNPLESDTELLNSSATLPMSFYNKMAPLAGRSGLDKAAQDGVIRKATDEDLDAWRVWKGQPITGGSYAAPSSPASNVYIINGAPFRSASQAFEKAVYVVLKHFTYPANLPDGTTFIIPKGAPRPPGYPGERNAVFDMNVPFNVNTPTYCDRACGNR